jgi:hypothetical protein
MNKKSIPNLPIILYFASICLLFLYSFTQIDLSLTFSRIEFLQNIVRLFQYVGYFQRPVSLYIYIGLLGLLFFWYFYFLKQALAKKIEKKFVWKMLVATTAILVFSYNAFSYDLFNYIFDAKIYTHYQLNPYLHKALDFPGDPMLSFMRWTHRVYPYGPFWLFLTIPLSYIGTNLFIPTFFLFKFIMAGSFLGCLYFIGKIFQKIAPRKEVYGLVFFGFNPLILIESLVSSHLDIVMAFFAVWALYQLIQKKFVWALVLLIFSIGIKFSTIFLIPVFVYLFFVLLKKKVVNWGNVFLYATSLMLTAVILSSVYSGNFQPWYLVLPITFAAGIAHRYFILIPSFALSFFALLAYGPFLFFGNWDPPIPQMLSTIYVSGLTAALLGILLFWIMKVKNYEK